MANEIDTEYIDNLMKSIEPVVYPDGAPKDEDDAEGDDVFGEYPDEEQSAESVEESVEEYSDDEQMEEVVDEYTEDIQDISYQEELDSIPEKGEKVALNNVEDQDEMSVVANDEISEIDDISSDQGESNGDSLDEPEQVEEEMELDLNMSEEEIEALLNSAKNVSDDTKQEVESEDVTDLLSLFGDDESISDIKETLDKADNNIAVDTAALDEPEVKLPDLDEEDGASDTKKKKEKKKRVKKDKKSKAEDDASEGAETKEKKPGFFARLIGALTEEQEEEIVVPESSETGITAENEQILSELDATQDEKGKKKKKKKGKKGKGSKDAPETEESEKDIKEKPDGDDSGEASGKGKKKKPKKEKKLKKEKAPQENERPSKKLPKKRVRNIVILCISILAAILILSFFGGDYQTKKQARFAFDNQEYDVSYADLYGMELKGEDELIFKKSQTIMFLTRKADSYENYMRLGMKPEALNSLLEGYDMAPKVIAIAEQLDVTEQVMKEYRRIVAGLQVFGLTEDDAMRIVSLESQVEYNRQLRAIAGGGQIPDSVESDIPFDSEGIDDVLPEELDFLPDNPEDILN